MSTRTASVTFRVKGLGPYVMETGLRRIDMEIEPMSVIIEGPMSGEQRCFLAPDESKQTEALSARIVEKKQTRPHIYSASATIYDALAEPSAPTERVSCGYATIFDFHLSITRRAMDELLRRDADGHRIFYLTLAISGLQRATAESSEGDLIRYVWPADEEEKQDSSQATVEALNIHYYPSAAYEEKTEEPARPTRDDLLSFQAGVIGPLTVVVQQLRRQALVSVVGTALVLLVLLWKLNG
jgi:hypothetical protein